MTHFLKPKMRLPRKTLSSVAGQDGSDTGKQSGQISDAGKEEGKEQQLVLSGIDPCGLVMNIR